MVHSVLEGIHSLTSHTHNFHRENEVPVPFKTKCHQSFPESNYFIFVFKLKDIVNAILTLRNYIVTHHIFYSRYL